MQTKVSMGKSLMSRGSLLRTGPINSQPVLLLNLSRSDARERAANHRAAIPICVTQQPITEKKRWRFFLPAQPTTTWHKCMLFFQSEVYIWLYV